MKKLLNMKKKEKPIRTPKEKKPKVEKPKTAKIKKEKKEKAKKEKRMPKLKREKPKRQPKPNKLSGRNLPKPVSIVWGWLKWLGRQIMKLVRILPTLLPKKSEKDAPLLDGNVKVLPHAANRSDIIVTSLRCSTVDPWLKHNFPK